MRFHISHPRHTLSHKCFALMRRTERALLSDSHLIGSGRTWEIEVGSTTELNEWMETFSILALLSRCTTFVEKEVRSPPDLRILIGLCHFIAPCACVWICAQSVNSPFTRQRHVATFLPSALTAIILRRSHTSTRCTHGAPLTATPPSAPTWSVAPPSWCASCASSAARCALPLR